MAEGGFRFVDFAAHVRVLRALAGEEEGDLWRLGCSGNGAGFLAEFRDGFRDVRGDDGAAVGETTAAGGKRVGDVGERWVFGFQMVRESVRHGGQRFRRAGR